MAASSAARNTSLTGTLRVPLVPDDGSAGAWEWRTFDYQPRLWRDALHHGVRLGPGFVTAETYLLAGQSPANVKLRNDRVEVKQPIETGRSGVERWTPLGTQMFPLTRNAMNLLCDAWRRPRVNVHPSLLTPADLVSYLCSHAPDVRVVPLRKWRRAYRVHGCMVERTTVLVGGAVFESLSFAHPDAEALNAALQCLYLKPARNTNYVTWLKGLVDLPL